jgi:hypothetical protein
MRLLAAVALAIALIPSCGRDRESADLRIRFSKTGASEIWRFTLTCDWFRQPTACREASARASVLFPPEGVACPLPTGVWIAHVNGTWAGRNVNAEFSPCFDGGTEAVEEWMRLFSFQPPP